MTRLFLCLSIFLIGMSSAAFSADTDRDGLPDGWEIVNGRNPLRETRSLFEMGCNYLRRPDTWRICDYFY